MSLLQLNTALQTFFNTSTGSEMTTLRNSVSSLWDTEAPDGTPYPVFVFENVSTQNNPSFCTDIMVCPIDLTIYADTNEEALELGYYVRKAFSNEILTLSGDYTMIGAAYDGTFSTYNNVEAKYQSTVSINYNIESPQELFLENNEYIILNSQTKTWKVAITESGNLSSAEI